MKLEPLDEQPETVDIKMADGIFARLTKVRKAGTLLPQHAHRWDHTSFIAHGAVKVFLDGKEVAELHAPYGKLIEAGTKHAFVTVEDDTVIACLHRYDRIDGIEIAEENSLEEAIGHF
jgi:quercetin dioxygenase-like cupin family protein